MKQPSLTALTGTPIARAARPSRRWQKSSYQSAVMRSTAARMDGQREQPKDRDGNPGIAELRGAEPTHDRRIAEIAKSDSRRSG